MAEDADRRPIHRGNFLNKLSFLRFGIGIAKSHDALKSDLLAFWDQLAERPLARTAIANWFKRESGPGRNAGFAFVRQYLDFAIVYSDLPDERKQVYSQILRYIRKAEGPGETDKVHLSSRGGVVIDTDTRFDRIPKLASTLVGTYICYKMRFSEEQNRPIAREILRIFRKQRELRFEQWVMKQGGSIDRFDGVVVSLNNVIWFFGTSRTEADRLRVMLFRRTDEHNTHSDHYRWGLALSEIPYSASREPAAARVLVIPTREAIHTDRDVEAIVAHLSPADLPEELRPVILRLIDNHVSAYSTPGTSEPAVSRGGEPVTDLILKVDQRTMDAAVATLSVEDF